MLALAPLCAAVVGCSSPGKPSGSGGAPGTTVGGPFNGGSSANSATPTVAAGGTSMGSGGTSTGSGGALHDATGGAVSSPPAGGTAGASGAAGSAGSAPSSGGATHTGMDAGGGGASLATLAARCQSGAALCDDFETVTSGAPDTAKWNVLTSYSGQPSTVNSVVVDTAQHASGARSLHVHTATGDPVYIETKSLPGTGNHFFVRAFAYFDVDPGARTRGHWGAFVGVGREASSSQDVEVRFGGQFDILVANYSPNDALQISSSRDGFYDDGARLPVRTWTCLEVEFDGATDELRVFMDDAELDRLHVTDWGQFGHQPTPAWSPAYARLRIGYQSWNADTPVDVWYDAVVVDTMRVGCAR